MQAGTTPIFNVFCMTWTQYLLGVEPTIPLGQCWVPPYCRLLRSAGATEGILATMELHQEPPQGESTLIVRVMLIFYLYFNIRRFTKYWIGDYSHSLPRKATWRSVWHGCDYLTVGTTSNPMCSCPQRGINESAPTTLPKVLFVCLFVCGISLTSGQLISELFPDCTRSCFLQVVSRRRGGDRIYEMRCLFVAVGPNARFIVLPSPVCKLYCNTSPPTQLSEKSSRITLTLKRLEKK